MSPQPGIDCSLRAPAGARAIRDAPEAGIFTAVEAGARRPAHGAFLLHDATRRIRRNAIVRT